MKLHFDIFFLMTSFLSCDASQIRMSQGGKGLKVSLAVYFTQFQ